MKARTKIWVGVGAFVFAGSAAVGPAGADRLEAADMPRAASDADLWNGARGSAAHIVVPQHHDASQPSAGEGGEGGEAGVANLPPDLGFAVEIGQLRGHLLVGDELVKQGQWAAALPHFLHPTEEIYGQIRDKLKDYDTPPFEDALNALAKLVKARKGGEPYAQAFKAVEDVLQKTDAGLRNRQPDWDGFLVEAAVELIKSSAGEYGEAIVDGRIAKPVEYQDARGFVWEGEKMIEAVAPALERKDAEALRQVRAALAEVKKAFPQPMPQKKPVKDQAAFLSDISRLELAAGKLM